MNGSWTVWLLGILKKNIMFDLHKLALTWKNYSRKKTPDCKLSFERSFKGRFIEYRARIEMTSKMPSYVWTWHPDAFTRFLPRSLVDVASLKWTICNRVIFYGGIFSIWPQVVEFLTKYELFWQKIPHIYINIDRCEGWSVIFGRTRSHLNSNYNTNIH